MMQSGLDLVGTSVEVAEDDGLRSQFVRRLISSEAAPCVAGGLVPPRLLVQFWDDAATVPEDVGVCLGSWKQVEDAGFKRVLFDDVSARRFIEDHFSERHVLAFGRCHHPAMRADYFRLCFILQVGGLYVDADDEYVGNGVEFLVGDGRLRLQALCYDIASGSMIDVMCGLAVGPRDELIFYVNNNPLIAPPGHPVIAGALERSTTLLLGADEANRDIQTLTGPGNLTASLVAHAVRQEMCGGIRDFELLTSWNSVAVSKWPLAYRADRRNWRNWIRVDG